MIICGTGHRPDKLGGYSDEVFQKLETLAYVWLVSHKPDEVISGGALGWDQALASAARRAKIPFILALPFDGFEKKWPPKSQDYLYTLMKSALRCYHVCEQGYAPWKMQERNKWMVDRADVVLALWNGTDGGTANCVRYAEKKWKKIVNLWDDYDDRTRTQREAS